jgi:pimeloyl-ACP methyl ester carboxylesterase
MKAYLIPGAFEDLRSKGYRDVLDIYKQKGYEPQFVKITWPRKTFDDYIDEVKNQIPKQELEGSILSGFSWGAMLALILTAEYQTPKQLLLFSLSPYFSEDFPIRKTFENWAGPRRISAFKKLFMNALAAEIKCPTTIFVGSEEVSKYSDMERRTNEAHKRIKGSRLITVEGAKHDISDPRYLKAIEKELAASAA